MSRLMRLSVYQRSRDLDSECHNDSDPVLIECKAKVGYEFILFTYIYIHTSCQTVFYPSRHNLGDIVLLNVCCLLFWGMEEILS